MKRNTVQCNAKQLIAPVRNSFGSSKHNKVYDYAKRLTRTHARTHTHTHTHPQQMYKGYDNAVHQPLFSHAFEWFRGLNQASEGTLNSYLYTYLSAGRPTAALESHDANAP